MQYRLIMLSVGLIPLLLLLLSEGYHGLRFHSYYGDGMVLQRDVPVQLWGYRGDQVEDEVEANLSCVGRDGARYDEILSVNILDDDIWSLILPPRVGGDICDIEV